MFSVKYARIFFYCWHLHKGNSGQEKCLYFSATFLCALYMSQWYAVVSIHLQSTLPKIPFVLFCEKLNPLYFRTSDFSNEITHFWKAPASRISNLSTKGRILLTFYTDIKWLNLNYFLHFIFIRVILINYHPLYRFWENSAPPPPQKKYAHLCCIPIQAILSCIVRSVSFPFFLEKLQKSNIHTSSSKLNNSSLQDQACYVLWHIGTFLVKYFLKYS